MCCERISRNDGVSTDRRAVLRATGVAAAGAVGLAGCLGTEGGDGSGEVGDSVLVGQPASLTGTWDYLQPAASAATDLAVQQINDAGGALDVTFEVERQDTAVETQQAREVVSQFVNNDDVVAINGLFSSELEPLWDFLQEQEVPIITPWPGSTYLDTRGGDKGTDDVSDDEWLWRTVIGDTVHTAGAAQAMIEEAGIERMGILSATSAGEEGWTRQFTNWYEQLGGEIVEVISAQGGQASYQSQLNQLFESDFDAWALSFGLEDAITIIQNWQDGGYGRQLLMEDGLRDGALIDEVGAEAEGAWIAAGSSEGPNYDQFLEGFQEVSDEELHPWGVAAYDATNVIALAVHHAGGVSPEDVQRSIGDVSRSGGTTVTTFGEGKEALDAGEEINYEGAVTNVDFTDHGNVWGDVVVERITPDGFETEFTVAADQLQSQIDEY